MSKVKFRVDAAAIKYVETVAQLRTPGLIAFAGLFGLQVVLTARWDWGLAWVPPTAALSMAIWFILGYLIARRKWPQVTNLWTVVRAYLFVGEPSDSSQRGKLRFLLLITCFLLAVPGWVGLLTAMVVTVVVIYLPTSKRLVAGEMIFGLIGIAALVLFGSVLGHRGLGLFTGLSGGIGLSIGALMVLIWVLSLQHSKASGSRLFWSERFAMLFAFLPLALFFFSGSKAVFVAFSIVCVVLPGFFLAYLLFKLIGEESKARRGLEPGALRTELKPKTLSGAEDSVRESDGFFRLCAPHYIKVEPTQSDPKVGPKGMLAWVGGGMGDNTIPQDVGECLVFRNMGVDDALAFDLPDRVTQKVRLALAEAVPNFDPERRRELLGELSAPWNVRHLSSANPTLIAKMPWEHHELLVLPVQWNGTVAYPTGTGLHDAKGLPCYFDNVDIRIDIVPEIVEAAKNPACADELSKKRLAELQANYRRVLPAVYEAIYGLLICELRKFSLPLLYEHGEGVEELGQRMLEALQEALSNGLENALPKPIGSLVKVSVANLSQPDTLVLSASQRAVVTDYRAIQSTMATTQYNKLRKLESDVKESLYGKPKNQIHTERLRMLRGEVLSAAADCQFVLNESLSVATDKLDASAVPGAMESIGKGYVELLDTCDRTINSMTRALDSIGAAFNDIQVNSATPPPSGSTDGNGSPP